MKGSTSILLSVLYNIVERFGFVRARMKIDAMKHFPQFDCILHNPLQWGNFEGECISCNVYFMHMIRVYINVWYDVCVVQPGGICVWYNVYFIKNTLYHMIRVYVYMGVWYDVQCVVRPGGEIKIDSCCIAICIQKHLSFFAFVVHFFCIAMPAICIQK